MEPRRSLAAAGLLAALTFVAATAGFNSATAGAAPAGGPFTEATPTVIGTAAAGKQLTGLSGSWGGLGSITYRFQWYRCNAAGAGCQSIHGATSPTFVLGVRDIGKTLGLTVYASDSTGTSAAFASLVGPIAPRLALLEATAQPVATGTPIQGRTVQVTTGTWSPTPANLTYRWERCNANGRACGAIPNGTGSSYTLAAADVGHALLAVVQATNGTTIQNAFSTSTPAVVDGSARGPKASIGPSVSGLAVVGQQVEATPGLWHGVGPIVFGYRWYRCDGQGAHCTLISGVQGSLYTLEAKDTGGTIGLIVRATDSTGAVSAYTALLGPVAAAGLPLTVTSAPTISGTARAGGTLTAGPGVWAPAMTAFTYSWLRCNANGRLCEPIPGASRPTYRATAADRGHALIVSVSAAGGGATVAALSAPTAPIT